MRITVIPTGRKMPFLRSLITDIADAVGEPPSIGPVDEHQSPLTNRKHAATDALLRNL